MHGATKKANGGKDDKQTPPGRFYCNVKPTVPREYGPGVSADRASAINVHLKKWVNGTELTFYFFDKTTDGTNITLADGSVSFMPWRGAADQMEAVRMGFRAWSDLGIGIKFKEVDSRDRAMVRIGFMPGDGSWSYVGREILDIATDQRTMNFGWNIADDVDTAIHEIGHTLGSNMNTRIRFRASSGTRKRSMKPLQSLQIDGLARRLTTTLFVSFLKIVLLARNGILIL